MFHDAAIVIFYPGICNIQYSIHAERMYIVADSGSVVSKSCIINYVVKFIITVSVLWVQ